MRKGKPQYRRNEVILAIDQGTTQTKAVLLDPSMQILAEAAEEFPQHYPHPGWVEHDPSEILESVRGAVRAALKRARLKPSSIAAVGITNQRETTVVWNARSGKSLGRAIVWQDRRTAGECAALKSRGLEKRVRDVTGLVLDPYFSGTKIAWILKHFPGARESAVKGRLRFGTIDTYLLWNLTGGEVHATDVSNASRTLLLNLKSCRWDEEMLQLFRIPRALLPEVLPNDQVLGKTRGLDFLPDGIPIAGLIGDQQAALFGQACFGKGEAKCTYGTGSFLLVNTDRLVRSRNGLVSTAGWKLGRETTYVLEGSVFIAGAAVQWLRDGLGLIGQSPEVEPLAASVPDSGGVVLVPALTGLGAPHWRPDAKGLITGITRGTTAAHIARAALEGIAFQCNDVLKAMERDLKRPLRAIKVDGGAAANDLLLQFQADILGKAILRPTMTSSTTALGAAFLAGLAAGIFRSLSEIRAVWREDRRFRPRISRRAAEKHLQRWESALARV